MDSRCPLKLNKNPCEACPLGENLFLTRIKKHKRCSCKHPKIDDFETMICSSCVLPLITCNWGINSEEYNFCSWVYLTENDGLKITDTQVAEFINLTVQRVGQIKKKSLNFLNKQYGSTIKYLISNSL